MRPRYGRCAPHCFLQQRIGRETPLQGIKRLNPPWDRTHIWVGSRPTKLPTGTHLLEVRAEDAYGEDLADKRPLRVKLNHASVD